MRRALYWQEGRVSASKGSCVATFCMAIAFSTIYRLPKHFLSKYDKLDKATTIFDELLSIRREFTILAIYIEMLEKSSASSFGRRHFGMPKLNTAAVEIKATWLISSSD